MQTNKITCYCFIDGGRRNEIPGLETKELLHAAKAEARAPSWFDSVPPVP